MTPVSVTGVLNVTSVSVTGVLNVTPVSVTGGLQVGDVASIADTTGYNSSSTNFHPVLRFLHF